MTPLGRRSPMLRHALANGAPRHFHVVCSKDCGWRGQRTADCAEDIPLGRRCPRCSSTVKAVTE